MTHCTHDSLTKFNSDIANSIMLTCVSKDYRHLNIVPHLIFENDIAVIFKVKLSENEFAIVTNSLAKLWNTTLDDLWEYGVKNASVSIIALNELLGLPDFGNTMFVARNGEDFGSGCVFIPEFLDSCKNRIGEDFYALPSSIHEWLLVPVSDSDPNALKAMVQSVNDSEVSENERLSYSVYKYCAKTKHFGKVA